MKLFKAEIGLVVVTQKMHKAEKDILNSSTSSSNSSNVEEKGENVKLRCTKCSHIWDTRKDRIPVACSYCKTSTYYHRPMIVRK